MKQLNKLEKQQKVRPKSNLMKEIITIRTEINEINILKINIKYQRIAELIFPKNKQKSVNSAKAGGITLAEFKLYCKTILMKIS